MPPLRSRSPDRGYHMRLDGLDCPILVKHHPRARRLTLKLSRTRRHAVLTMPPHVSLSEAGDFLARHVDWLRDRAAQLPASVAFAQGCEFPLRGVPTRIVFLDRIRGVVRLVPALSADETDAIEVPGGAEHGPRRLTDWLKREARGDLQCAVDAYAERLDLRAGRLQLRDQVSRWGSCSSTGTLSFSWRLVLAPPFVLDYVAAHEVVHLAHMDHGKRFWSTLRAVAPETERAEKWLKHHGGDLHRYG